MAGSSLEGKTQLSCQEQPRPNSPGHPAVSQAETVRIEFSGSKEELVMCSIIYFLCHFKLSWFCPLQGADRNDLIKTLIQFSLRYSTAEACFKTDCDTARQADPLSGYLLIYLLQDLPFSCCSTEAGSGSDTQLCVHAVGAVWLRMRMLGSK